MKDKTSVGNSGEYFVAGELERHGFTAAVPMSNTKDFDILAIDRKTYKQFAIQVKTTSEKQKKCTLAVKNESLIGENNIYLFVSLNEFDAPEYHIVPSKDVALAIKSSHKKWPNTPGKRGQAHNDNPRREFCDKNDRYLNNWNSMVK